MASSKAADSTRALPTTGAMARRCWSPRAGLRLARLGVVTRLLSAPALTAYLAGLAAAGLVLITLLVLIPLFGNLPTAALGAVIILTASRLINLGELRRLWRVRRSDFALALITFAGVLALGVLNGIGVGVLASLLEVMRRAVMPTPPCSAWSPEPPPTASTPRSSSPTPTCSAARSASSSGLPVPRCAR